MRNGRSRAHDLKPNKREEHLIEVKYREDTMSGLVTRWRHQANNTRLYALHTPGRRL